MLFNVTPLVLTAQSGPVAIVHEFREVHLGMEVRLMLIGTAPEAGIAARAAYDRIDSLNLVLSDWDRHSELRRLEDHPPGQWVTVSAPIREVLALALAIARATDGAFDPTVGPLTTLWREARRTGLPASDSAIATARHAVGYRLVELDSVASRLRYLVAGMRLDFGAIAKGWILDEVTGVLRASGIANALVEAGGDLVVLGKPPGEPGWRISVDLGARDTVLVLTSGAVSTSGPTAQFIAGEDGVRESHVIIGATGRGAVDGRAVTVVGPRAAITDALATALTLVPRDRAAALAERYGVTVIGESGASGP